ncbi:MAG: AAA family ATPase [Desulfobacterales bacterium]|nr:AAA family ATPase [Desulfobacterales bacterium]
MKITQLWGKNLNSLKGEFNINFDELSQTGIFAITGHTGAGKTTILDAICVALYGKTPRLKEGIEISELMTQHTTDCYAKVEFQLKNKKYQSEWSLKRSRGKVDGKIQPPTMKLFDVSENRIIEERKQEAAKKIVNITGLEYGSFTKSILLAQGDFAAFLKADKNIRAELLEKMTGTEIYRLISEKVYQRAKKEEQNLSNLEIAKQSIKTLSEEEFVEIQNKKQTIQNDLQTINETLKQIESNKQWLQSVEKLEQTIIVNEDEINRIFGEIKKNEELFIKLKKAEISTPMKGEFESILNERKSLNRLKNEISNLHILIAELTKKDDNTSILKEDAEKKHKEFIRYKEHKESLIVDAEKKDTQIIEKQKVLSENTKSLKKLKIDLSAIVAQVKALSMEKTSIKEEIKKCIEYKEKNSIDENLIVDLPLISERLKELSKKYSDKNTKLNEINLIEKNIKNFENVLDAESKNLEQINKTLEIKYREKNNEDIKLKKLLSDKTIQEWEDNVSLCFQKKNNIEKAMELVIGIKKSIKKIETNEKDYKTTLSQLEEKKKQDNELSCRMKEEEEILNQLEEKRTLELLASKYKEDRNILREGSPCPLCGAISHPWAEKIIENLTDSQKALSTQKKKLDNLKKQLDSINKNIVELTSSENHLKTLLYEEKNNLLNVKTKLDEVLKQAVLTSDDENIIKQDYDKNNIELEGSQKIISDIKSVKNLIEALNTDISKIEKKKNELNLSIQDTRSKKENFSANLEKVKKEYELFILEAEHLEKNIYEQVSKYGEIFQKNQISLNLEKNLKKRKTEFENTANRLKTLDIKLTPIIQKLSGNKGNLKSSARAKAKIIKDLKESKFELEALKNERFVILGDENTVKLKNDLKSKQAELDLNIGKLLEESVKIKLDLNSNKQVLSQKQNDYKSIEENENNASRNFLEKLLKLGFKDETDFLNSFLSDEEMERIKKIEEDLKKRKSETETRLNDAKESLKEKMISPQTAEKLSDVLKQEKELKGKADEGNREIGAINETINNQIKLQSEIKSIESNILLQKKEFDKWRKLRDMIGSADGKKFRLFAQSLTFDYLIAISNDHMKKLSDRYFLRRKDGDNLDIEIIDIYQAEAARHVNTLSGGETFLVSLALALGLSGIVSNDARIDSFFLDEGFGSLDNETLETVLSALDSLNSTGKTIGIISHLDVLKERIPCQIEVKKMAGGMSNVIIRHSP